MVTVCYLTGDDQPEVGDLVEHCSREGLTLVGVDNVEGSIALEGVALPRRACLVFGSEASGLSEEMIRAIVRDCSRVTLPHLSPDVQRRCTFAYGQKDSDLRLARRTVPRLYPDAELVVWPGWGHCERMSRDSRAYGAMLRNVALGGRETTA